VQVSPVPIYSTALFPLALRLAIPHVPLGRALLTTVIGTIVGATLESLLSHAPLAIFLGAFVGFGLAVAVAFAFDPEPRRYE
jgi:hypothetical protein